ncbi:MAG: IS200/IS605 family transposase [Blastocatellales bacterium]
MADTYSSLFYHIVFSTKNRQRFIRQEIETAVWSYIGGIARKNKMKALQVGGVEDHLHALIMAPPKVAPSQIAQYLKGGSSHWLRRQFHGLDEFAWQEGYSVFSVSRSNLERVAGYIRRQRQHHDKKQFVDEYRDLLERHGINYDERYLL